MRTSNHLNIYSRDFQKSCAEIVEKELASYFNTCSKSAYAYSLMVSKDFKSHNASNFEKIVLNYEELTSVIENILYKLNDSIDEFQIAYESDLQSDFMETLHCLKRLDKTVMQNKTTHNISVYCEKIIDKTLLKSFNLFYSGLISNYFLGKVNFGTIILGKNSSKKITEAAEKELNNKIQGMLMNVKIDIRNLILKNVMEQIEDYTCSEIIA